MHQMEGEQTNGAPLGSGERKIQKLCACFYSLCGWIVNCGYYRLPMYILHMDRLVNCAQFWKIVPTVQFIFLPLSFRIMTTRGS